LERNNLFVRRNGKKKKILRLLYTSKWRQVITPLEQEVSDPQESGKNPACPNGITRPPNEYIVSERYIKKKEDR